MEGAHEKAAQGADFVTDETQYLFCATCHNGNWIVTRDTRSGVVAVSCRDCHAELLRSAPEDGS